ncbi:ribosomal protein S5 domain 2-like protein [Eremomyces bilateralis CBS 781.70]|uniref:Ribosomal protein S5 domain 2-like protein n=1 Tax=Eremomyces bilateralis CBS 781.70 TaxID=1392243 RepID=A0A6G1FU16_9PEZI|nr:ribosomal protein S5 domain 2-like protein [Eremomyces bilateralis CBS 781.70]KAF1809198.1 ribosomal protein S5 domain 2-like protein [Eremomyces bilateralis CBS 781.70]
MPLEPKISVNEREFLLDALRQNLRLSGRKLDALRPLSITFDPDDYGVTEVQLGKTRIRAHTQTTITNPPPSRPFEGTLTITAELSPLTAPHFELARPSDTEALLSRLLEKSIRRSGALPVESLCLLAGDKCFNLRVTVHVLAHDGGLPTAAFVAVLASLMTSRVPATEVRGGEVQVFTAEEREGVRLQLVHVPIAVGVSVFDGGAIGVVDADGMEEQAREGEVVVVGNEVGEICGVTKWGGVDVGAVELVGMVEEARKQCEGVVKWLKGKVEEEEKRRAKRDHAGERSAENQR